MSKKTFHVNNSLYPEVSILQAISQFQGYNIIFSHDTLVVDDEDPQYVFDELMNYTLSILLENPIGA